MRIKVISPGASGLSIGEHTVDGANSMVNLDISSGTTVRLPDTAPVVKPVITKEPEVVKTEELETPSPAPVVVTAPVKLEPAMPDYENMSYNKLRQEAATADIVLPRTADKEKYVAALTKKWKKDHA